MESFTIHSEIQSHGRLCDNGLSLFDITKFRKAIVKSSVPDIKQIFDKMPKKQVAEMINLKTSHIPNIMLALGLFNYKIIKFLIDNGADLNITAIKSDSSFCYFNNLETPLIAEAKIGNNQTVYTLINHGADIYIRDGNGKSALDYANENGHKKIIKLLKKKDEQNELYLFN